MTSRIDDFRKEQALHRNLRFEQVLVVRVLDETCRSAYRRAKGSQVGLSPVSLTYIQGCRSPSPDSSVGAVHRAPGDFPSGKKGDVLTVELTVMGIPCLGLNGGSAFKHNEAFSFQVATADQAETDRYWNAIIGNGGQESACGWCKDGDCPGRSPLSL